MDWYVLTKTKEGIIRGEGKIYLKPSKDYDYGITANIKEAILFDITTAVDVYNNKKHLGWVIERYKEGEMKYNYVLKSKQTRDEFGSSLFVLDAEFTDCGVELFKLTSDIRKAKRYDKEMLPPTGFDKVEVKAPVYEQIDKETLLDLLYYYQILCGRYDPAVNHVLYGYSTKLPEKELVDKINQMGSPF